MEQKSTSACDVALKLSSQLDDIKQGIIECNKGVQNIMSINDSISKSINQLENLFNISGRNLDVKAGSELFNIPSTKFVTDEMSMDDKEKLSLSTAIFVQPVEERYPNCSSLLHSSGESDFKISDENNKILVDSKLRAEKENITTFLHAVHPETESTLIETRKNIATYTKFSDIPIINKISNDKTDVFYTQSNPYPVSALSDLTHNKVGTEFKETDTLQHQKCSEPAGSSSNLKKHIFLSKVSESYIRLRRAAFSQKKKSLSKSLVKFPHKKNPFKMVKIIL